MNTEQLCQHCRKPIGAHAIDDLCPECLMKMGMGINTEASIPGATPTFRAPSIEELAPLFPQFELLAFVGQGGMGAVYKARQKQLARTVALKILPPGIGDKPGFAERFTREAMAMARLNHPGIVTIHDFGQVQAPAFTSSASQDAPPPLASANATAPTVPLYYLVMEFVDGISLRQLLRSGRISPREALAIVPQVCDALQYAHDQGIVHRDVKPENILLDRQGRVKVADFGLAKLMEGRASVPTSPELVADQPPPLSGPNLTDAGHVMGTPNYIAPEQLAHPQDVDHRADIYSLGVTLYEMLTGELPIGKFAPPSRKVQVDVRLDQVVLHALEKEPDLRYQQARDVKTDVTAISGTIAKPGSAASAAAAFSSGTRVPTPRRTRLVTAALVCLVVFLFALLGSFLVRRSEASGLKSSQSSQASRSQSHRIAKATDCIANWRAANEGMDSMGKHNVLQFSEVRLAQGDYGMAFDFENSQQRIVVPDAPAFHFGPRQDFSIEAWIQAQPASTSFQLVTIVDKHHTSNTVSAVGFLLGLWNGRLGCMLSDDLAPGHRTDYISPAEAPDLRDNKLHHVAMIVERGDHPRGKLYADGQEVLTFDPAGQLGDLSNSEPLRIGNHANPDLDCFFRGLLYEVAIYKRALSPEEIRNLCAARPKASRVRTSGVPTQVSQTQAVSQTQQTLQKAIPATPDNGWDFSFGFKSIDDPNADRYVVDKQNVRKYSEWQHPPITYWGPMKNDMPATMTLRFNFAAPTSEIFLKAQLNSANKDGTAYGSCSLWGSTDGDSWELLLDNPKPFPGHFLQLYYKQPVPASLLGSTSLWLQVRMQETGALNEAPDPNATWAQAQFSRLDPEDPGNVFQLNVREIPNMRPAHRGLWPTHKTQTVGGPVAKMPAKEDLIGTWELLGTKEDGAADFTPMPKERRQIALITPYRFLWVAYNTTSGEVQAEAGGPYSLKGDICTETNAFIKGTALQPGGSVEYRVRIDGDKCYLEPQNSAHRTVETWQRVVENLPGAEGSVRKQLVGAWEMIEWRPWNTPNYIKTPPERRRVKFFTMTWSAWAEYDTKGRIISMGCGGPYSAPDGFYHETLQFTDGFMRGFQGGHTKFKLQVEGDIFRQLALGKSNNDEIWERIKE